MAEKEKTKHKIIYFLHVHKKRVNKFSRTTFEDSTIGGHHLSTKYEKHIQFKTIIWTHDTNIYAVQRDKWKVYIQM